MVIFIHAKEWTKETKQKCKSRMKFIITELHYYLFYFYLMVKKWFFSVKFLFLFLLLFTEFVVVVVGSSKCSITSLYTNEITDEICFCFCNFFISLIFIFYIKNENENNTRENRSRKLNEIKTEWTKRSSRTKRKKEKSFSIC